MIQILAILGILGGCFCVVADCLLDIKGAENRKLGMTKIIDSKWKTMSHYRFIMSGIIVMFVVPMYSCGFIALMKHLGEKNSTMATILTIYFYVELLVVS